MYRWPPDEFDRPCDLSQHGIYKDLGEALAEAKKVNDRIKKGPRSEFFVWTTKEGPHWSLKYLLKIGVEFSLLRIKADANIIKRADPLKPYKEFDYEYE